MPEYKVGDFVRLKPWNQLPKNRQIGTTVAKCSPDAINKEFYGKGRYKITDITNEGQVVYLKFPSKSYPQPILMGDIDPEDGSTVVSIGKDKKLVRPIRGRMQEVKEEILGDDEEQPLKELHINTQDKYLLHVEGLEHPMEVCFENIVCFDDDSPKKQKRITISGVVIPKEVKPVRRIRK